MNKLSKNADLFAHILYKQFTSSEKFDEFYDFESVPLSSSELSRAINELELYGLVDIEEDQQHEKYLYIYFSIINYVAHGVLQLKE